VPLVAALDALATAALPPPTLHHSLFACHLYPNASPFLAPVHGSGSGAGAGSDSTADAAAALHAAATIPMRPALNVLALPAETVAAVAAAATRRAAAVAVNAALARTAAAAAISSHSTTPSVSAPRSPALPTVPSLSSAVGVSATTNTTRESSLSALPASHLHALVTSSPRPASIGSNSAAAASSMRASSSPSIGPQASFTLLDGNGGTLNSGSLSRIASRQSSPRVTGIPSLTNSGSGGGGAPFSLGRADAAAASVPAVPVPVVPSLQAIAAARGVHCPQSPLYPTTSAPAAEDTAAMTVGAAHGGDATFASDLSHRQVSVANGSALGNAGAQRSTILSSLASSSSSLPSASASPVLAPSPAPSKPSSLRVTRLAAADTDTFSSSSSSTARTASAPTSQTPPSSSASATQSSGDRTPRTTAAAVDDDDAALPHPTWAGTSARGLAIDPDFLALCISSHLQTMANSVVVGHDEALVNVFIETLSFFVSEQQRQMSRYACARAPTSSATTFPSSALQSASPATVSSQSHSGNHSGEGVDAADDADEAAVAALPSCAELCLNCYMPDMALQGIIIPVHDCSNVCFIIFANITKWDLLAVKLIIHITRQGAFSHCKVHWFLSCFLYVGSRRTRTRTRPLPLFAPCAATSFRRAIRRPSSICAMRAPAPCFSV
jgi:hypothetical protein